MKYKFIYLILAFIVLVLVITSYSNHTIVYDVLYYLTKPALPKAISYLESKIDRLEDLAVGEAIASSSEAVEHPAITTSDLLKMLSRPLAQEINLDVPFQAQAPFGNWQEPYQDACEEASLIMVDHYLRGVGLTKQEMKDEIDQRIAWETNQWGYEKNLSLEKVQIVAKTFYPYKTDIITEPTIDQIRLELNLGRPVIVPLEARLLKNPNYTPPGPVYHVIVIRGYTANGNFITNDPGTHLGADYLYNEEVIMSAIHDWDGTKPAGYRLVLVMYE